MKYSNYLILYWIVDEKNSDCAELMFSLFLSLYFERFLNRSLEEPVLYINEVVPTFSSLATTVYSHYQMLCLYIVWTGFNCSILKL